MRTRVKICGLTRVEDAIAAAQLGADAIGLVFYEPSPRNITPEQAARLVASLPAFVNRVGLFVNATPDFIEAVLQQVPLDTLQFHGDEDRQACERYGIPYMKALKVRSAELLAQQLGEYESASALLLDAYHPKLAGGTGDVFDWELFPKQSSQPLTSQPLVLAGGLTPENVERAIQVTQPYAVDVSGGVEQSKGVKSFELMQAFIQGVNRVKRET